MENVAHTQTYIFWKNKKNANKFFKATQFEYNINQMYTFRKIIKTHQHKTQKV